MGIMASTSTDGLTPICNECGVRLCWDISHEEYAQRPDFWDCWVCQDCRDHDVVNAELMHDEEGGSS
jgi:hypothetical protein